MRCTWLVAKEVFEFYAFVASELAQSLEQRSLAVAFALGDFLRNAGVQLFQLRQGVLSQVGHSVSELQGGDTV